MTSQTVRPGRDGVREVQPEPREVRPTRGRRVEDHFRGSPESAPPTYGRHPLPSEQRSPHARTDGIETAGLTVSSRRSAPRARARDPSWHDGFRDLVRPRGDGLPWWPSILLTSG